MFFTVNEPYFDLLLVFIFYFLSSFLCGVGITTFLVSFLAENVLFVCYSAAVFFFEYSGELLLFTALFC